MTLEPKIIVPSRTLSKSYFRRNIMSILDIISNVPDVFNDEFVLMLLNSMSSGVLDYVTIAEVYTKIDKKTTIILKPLVLVIREYIYSILKSSFYTLPLEDSLKYLLFRTNDRRKLYTWIEKNHSYLLPFQSDERVLTLRESRRR